MPKEGKIKYWNVSPVSFTRQMDFLYRKKFNVITIDEFIDCKEKNLRPPSKSIIISFDDGYADNYIYAMPILDKYNFKPTFFVVTDYIDSQETFQWQGLKWDKPSLEHCNKNRASWLPLSESMILDMSRRGASFGSHTKSHLDLTQLERKEVIRQIINSKKRLEAILSHSVDCLSYPFGKISEEAKNLVKTTGYKAAVGSIFSSNNLKNDSFKLGRIIIEEQDSLCKFSNKVKGAYEWYGLWLRITQRLRHMLAHGSSS